MNKLYTLVSIFFTTFSATLAQLSVINPSFEGPQGIGITPSPWSVCNGTTPDTQPGQFQVMTAASNGNTYVGMVSCGTGLNCNEATSQMLSSPMVAGTPYILNLDLAFAAGYSGWTSPGTLNIYGGNTSCGLTQLLWTSGTLSNVTWITFNASFTPSSNWKYVTFINSSLAGLTNVLLDNLSPIYLAVPINLLYFSILEKREGVVLNWASGMESNFKEYIVERSNNESAFFEIGRIKGSKNPSANISFEDTHPLSGKNYYRLKQLDEEGMASFSNTISFNRYTGSGFSLSPFKNTNSLATAIFRSEATGKAFYYLCDMMGKKYQTLEIEVIPGENEISIDISSLPHGVFFFILEQPESGQKFVSRIVK